jgi:hypothetical protein
MDPTFATKILFVQCSIGTAALVALALELPQQAWALHLWEALRTRLSEHFADRNTNRYGIGALRTTSAPDPKRVLA